MREARSLRARLWRLATSRQTEGAMLPPWLLLVRAILYPCDFFYWWMNSTRGYQVGTDTWIIEGVRYSGRALKELANAQGETYRITRSGECVTLTRVKDGVDRLSSHTRRK